MRFFIFASPSLNQKRVAPAIETNVRDSQGHHLGVTKELALMVVQI